MSQKGGIVLLLLIMIVIAGIGVGAYFIVGNTSFFSKANQESSVLIPSAIPSPKATPIKKTASPSAVYENPFEAAESYSNPFEESYENPFNNL